VSTNSPAPKLKVMSQTPPPIATVETSDHRRKPAPVRSLTISHPSETLSLPITVGEFVANAVAIDAPVATETLKPPGPSGAAASVQPVPTPGPSQRRRSRQ
jgi:hypothetical protein